jgi:hypothetical protein
MQLRRVASLEGDTLVVFYSLNATKRVVSLEGDNLIVFYSLNATKRGGLS